MKKKLNALVLFAHDHHHHRGGCCVTVQFLCLKQQWKVGSLVFIAVSFCAADYSKKRPLKKTQNLNKNLVRCIDNQLMIHTFPGLPGKESCTGREVGRRAAF